MRSKLFAAFLAACLIMTMAACGNTENPVSGESAPAETAPQAFGNDLNDAPAETARTTDLPETGSGGPETQGEPDGMDAESDALRRKQTLKAISAVLYCDAVDQLSFSPDDPMYFWRAVGYMAGLTDYEGSIPRAAR